MLKMFQASSITFKKLGICICAVLGMCLSTEDAEAQSEQEKVEIENTRNMDKPVPEDHSSTLDGSSPKISTSKQTQPIVSAPPVRKELMGGEGKKNEPQAAPSTLSFNIFLYIVDKFKAD